jgi:molybdopterin-guanine dinucleotide biosynthesis protein B
MSHSSDEKRTTEAYRTFGGAVVGIYGWSGSGKTELITKLIGELNRRGYTVITAKHTAHEIPLGKGKDSERHRSAGSRATLFFNDTAGDIGFSAGSEEAMKLLASLPHDIILVEGMKGADWPKIAVGDIELRGNTVLRYPENTLEDIMAYLESEIKRAKAYLLLPGIDCELCGHRCLGLAGLIATGEKKYSDCVVLRKRNENRVRIKVGGKEVDLGKKFMDDLFYNTLTGMVKTLKGAGDGDIEITIRGGREE